MLQVKDSINVDLDFLTNELEPREKLLYLLLKSYIDRFWPSITLLASGMGCKERNVYGIKKGLEEKGWACWKQRKLLK